MKHFIDRFNNAETYLIISDYPESSPIGERNHGIAWHTKEMIDTMALRYEVQFVVLAQKGHNNEPQLYANGKILVLRVFDPNTHTLFPQILRWLFIFNRITKVQIHSEFCATGEIKNFILFLPFLFLITLFRKRVTYFMHNVVTDLTFLAPHLNLRKHSVLLHIFNTSLRFYYSLLPLFIHTFVVMDTVLAKRLTQFINEKKIITLPFWMKNTQTSWTKETAKAALNLKADEFVLLTFGFVSFYKGTDWIIRTVKNIQAKNPDMKIKLIVAGGPAYSLQTRKHYQEYYAKIQNVIQKQTGIILTGFIPEAQIPLYFTAADLVVLPYRGLMGASGSLAHAIEYRKPFIISSAMKEVMDAPDMQYCMEKAQLTLSDFTFNYTIKSFTEKIVAFKSNMRLQEKDRIFVANMAEVRSFERLVKRCYNELFHNDRIQKSSFHHWNILPRFH